MKVWTGLLLVVGGLVHAIPSVSTWLTDLTGGYPYVQLVVGVVSVVVGLWSWFAK